MNRWRAVAGWLPAVVLVPVAAVAGVVVSTPDDDLAAMREEQPLDLGTTWVYDVLDHGAPSGTRTSQVTGGAAFLDPERGDLRPVLTVTRHYTDYPGTGARDNVSYLTLDGDTVNQRALEERDTWLDVVPETIAYRVPAEVGLSWSYDGSLGTIELSSETELTEITDVEVSGRTFEGCAHFVTTVPLDEDEHPGAVEVLDEWTCPGYGTVLLHDVSEATGVDITEELTEFHGVEASWYADGHAPAPVEANDERGATEGFGSDRTYAVPDGTLGRDLAWTDLRSESGTQPPVSDGEVMVLAERDGGVSLRTTDTGEMRWRLRLDGPVPVPPVLAEGAVVVADSGKRLWALSVDDGRALWVRTLPDVISASPVATGGRVVVPTDDGTVTALDLTDGTTAWERSLAGAARTAPAADGEHVLVGDSSGTLTALDPADGAVDWSTSFDPGLAQGPLVAEGRVLVQDGDGIVHAFTTDGEIDWESRGRGAGAAPMTAGHGVVLTADRDRVSAFALTDGRRRWSASVPDTVVPAVVVGDEVVVQTLGGEVVVLDAEDGTDRGSWPLPVSSPDDEFVDRVAPALVDDTLVLTALGQGHDRLFAYPVGPDVAPGVALRFDRREYLGSPAEAPVLAGDAVLVPSSGALLKIGPDGTTTTLQTAAEGVQTGATVADGVVLARNGELLQARGLDDGELLWELPSGPVAYGARPASDGATAYFAHGDGILVAADLHSGQVRWATPVPDQEVPAQPLVLPDGDVVYGGGGLARYDAGTGEPRWRDRTLHLLGPAAYDAGTVYAVGADPDSGAARLVAVDARTGEQRWQVPVQDPALFLGPAVQDGVVVAFDGHTAHAVDAATGAELWSLTGSRPPAGPPVVADGRVLLVQQGQWRDIVGDEYRVTVHDARTGRLLAAWEPSGVPDLTIPTVGRTDDGRLLVPELGLTVVEVVG